MSFRLRHPTLRGIAIQRVAKRLRGRDVLRDIDFSVPPGSVTVVEGGNGTGKTTLIRIIATIMIPDQGHIFVDGWNHRTQSEEVRGALGVVLANDRSLIWRIDAIANLRTYGRLVGMSNAAAKKRAHLLLEQFGLEEVARERVGRLSTGQRQRLMIARALLADAPVLLVDEPLRGLDRDGVTVVINMLDACARRGAAILVTAPLVSELLPVANAHWVLQDGILGQERKLTPVRISN